MISNRDRAREREMSFGVDFVLPPHHHHHLREDDDDDDDREEADQQGIIR